eukprot:6195641-Pleurochrysis_carterae.AAC.3
MLVSTYLRTNASKVLAHCLTLFRVLYTHYTVPLFPIPLGTFLATYLTSLLACFLLTFAPTGTFAHLFAAVLTLTFNFSFVNSQLGVLEANRQGHRKRPSSA